MSILKIMKEKFVQSDKIQAGYALVETSRTVVYGYRGCSEQVKL